MLGGVGRTLITAGTLILLFVAYQLWGTGLQEAKAQDELRDRFDALKEQVAAANATSTTTTSTTTTAPTTTTTAAGGLQVVPREPVELAPADLPLPEIGDPIATIEIPKIGITRQVVEGANLKQLKRGPAHYEETPLPGQAGNAAIAGHRTTYGQPFHNIDKVEVGDTIEVETLQGTFTYEVDIADLVVQPDQTEVLLPTYDDAGVLENRITLTACEPKWSAARRLIVSGVLVGNPVPPIVGQEEARAEADTSGRDDEGEDAATLTSIDGGLSGVSSDKTPAVLWGLACAAVWLLTWLAQVALRRVVRARAAASVAPVARPTVDDDVWSTADPVAEQPAPTATAPPRPSRRARLLTWSPYVVGLPVFLVTLYVFFENFALLLPGNY